MSKLIKHLQSASIIKNFLHIKSNRKMLLRLHGRLIGWKRKLLLFPVVFAIIAGLVLVTMNKQAQAAWYNSSWSYRKALVIDETKVSGSTNLTNFPVLISRTDTDLQAYAQADGDDIVFTSADGSTKLDHELVSYSAGVLVAWVEVPTLNATTNTTIYMYYGNGAVSSQENVAATWSANHVGVWHLDESPANTVTGHLNSATNTNDGTPQNFGSAAGTTTNATGKVSGADYFDGGDDYVGITDNAALSFNPATNYTWSAWVNRDTMGADWEALWTQTVNNDSYVEFYTGDLVGDGTWGVVTDGVVFGIQSSAGNYEIAHSNNTVLTTGAWYHVAATYNPALSAGNKIKIYVNGVDVTATGDTAANGTLDSIDPNNHRLSENAAFPGENTDGLIDEFHMVTTNRTADWLLTEYNNQNSPAAFFASFGSQEESVDAPAAFLRFDEGNGTTANDATTNNNDASLSGTPPTWKTSGQCISENCLFFDGTDDVATITNADSIDMNGSLASGFTYQTWIRVNSDGEGNAGQILQKGTNTYLRVTNEGADGLADLEASVDLATADATANVVNGLTLNKWHNVAMTYSDDGDDEISVYIDGRLATTSSNGNGAPDTDTNDILIGGTSTANFHGFIDELKIYSDERSADEIKTDYIHFSGLNGTSSVLGENDTSFLSNGLVGYWKMDEASGNASDSSGNGTTLTNNGTTTYVSGKFANGSEHVPASSQHFSTATTINGVKSVSFWVNPDTTTNYYISLTSSADITSSSGTISATGFTNPTIYVNGTQTTTLAANTWQLVTIVSDTAINANQVYIGRQGSNYFDGTLDDVRFYNRLLSSTEVRSLYDWAPGPQIHLKLDEGAGTSTALDSSGNGLDADMIQGVNSWVTGKYGSALLFDGNNDALKIPNANNVLSASGSFTMSTWFKITDGTRSSYWAYPSIVNREALAGGCTSAAGLLGEFTSDTSRSIIFNLPYQNAGASCAQATTLTGPSLALNQWYHATATFDRTSGLMQLYLNGTLVSSGTWGGSGNHTWLFSEMYAGNSTDNSSASTNAFPGAIDDIKVYNYVRTAKQIISDMNAGHPIVGTPVASAIGHWKFDEGYGLIAHNSGNAGASLDLTFGGGGNNPVWSNAGKFGKAISSDGDDDYTYVPDSALVEMPNDMTVSAWFTLDQLPSAAGNDGKIVYKFDASAPFVGYELFIDSDDVIKFQIATGTNTYFEADDTTDAITGVWYHAVGVKSGTTMKLYINGVLKSTTTGVTGSIYDTTGALLVGGLASAAPDGLIDEVKLYNYALNADEVKTDYNQGKAQVFGTTSTASNGTTPGNSASREYCPPGNTETNCGSGDPSPIAEWKMDEGTGTSAQDTSGNGYVGTLSGGLSTTSWRPGKLVSGLEFDGDTDYVEVVQATAFDFGTSTNFSIEGWVKTSGNSGNNQDVMKYRSTTTGGFSFIIGSNNKLRAYVTDGAASFCTLDSTNTVTDNVWHHVVAVYVRNASCTTSDILIYIDGKKETTTVTQNGVNANTAIDITGVRMGDNDTSAINGRLDHVLIYNYARTPAQVAWDYNRGRPIAHWKFDECQSSTAYDASGNSYNGTITPGAGANTAVGTCSSGTASDMWNDGTAGKFNSSIGLDGSDDRVEIADTANLRFDAATADYSLFTWVKRTTTGTEYILSKEDGDNDGWRLLFNASNQVVCSQDASDATSTTAITDTNWHFIGCTIDRDGNGQVYIDGRADGATVALSSDTMATAVPIQIGTRAYTSPTFANFFNGLIDDVRIFNYVLTPSQIKLLYNENAAVRFGPVTGSP